MRTKNFLIIFIIVSFIGSHLNAQDYKYGFSAGLNIANARITENYENFEISRVYFPLLSFNINGYIGLKSKGFWGISTEPGFIQKGGVFTDPIFIPNNGISSDPGWIQLEGFQRNEFSVDNDGIKFKLNYIQIPILADLYLSEKIFISLGPEFAFLINAKAKYKDHSINISDLYDNNSYEISGMLGINYNIIKKIDLGLRYSHGFISSTENVWITVFGEGVASSKEYNQYLQIIIRFKI